MPSLALLTWQTESAAVLDEIEAAHVAVGTGTRGRRYATQQINQAYTVLLASQFQRFCRDLHSECIDRLAGEIKSDLIRPIVRARFMEVRRLDVGNPNPANLGSDYARLGITLWPILVAADSRNRVRQQKLEQLIRWRNAIAHQDFTSDALGGRTTVTFDTVRGWRSACGRLALDLERVMSAYLYGVTGVQAWK